MKMMTKEPKRAMDSNVELEMKRRENRIWVSLSDVKRGLMGVILQDGLIYIKRMNAKSHAL